MFKKNILFAFVFCLFIAQLNVAAIVSDNDGSAFVTKAEFDSLKNSFKKQIDDYSLSIDEKIDGAIAQYLSGLTLSTVDSRKAICYSVDGIYNVDKNTFKYDKGKMEWAFKYYQSRYSTNPTNINSELGTWMVELNFADTPTEFKEMLINHPDYTASNTAEWLGYSNTIQKLDTNQLFFAIDSAFGVDYSGYSSCYFAPVSDQGKFSTEASLEGLFFGKWGMVPSNSTPVAGTAYFNSFGLTPDSVTFVRTIKATHGDNAILTVKNLTETRFSNNDGFHDFMNDDPLASDYSTYHVETNKFSDVADSITTNSIFTHSYRADKLVILNFKVNTYFFKDVSSTAVSISTWTRPYAGFDKKITDYNKLFTSCYDDYILDIKAANSGATTGILQDKDGKEHLALFAGAPICNLKNEEKIVLDLQFEDKTKDYDVWLKFSPFDNVDAWDDSCIDANEICSGTSSTKAPAGSKNNSIKISGGVGQINWTADSQGIIFIKFAESGKNGLGAARLMMPKNVVVYKSF